MPVAIVNPRQVRDFAKATGTRTKTDALDAAVLSHFAEAIQPTVRTIADEDSQQMEELIARRQLVEMLMAEKNRLGTVRRSVRQDIEAHIEASLLNLLSLVNSVTICCLPAESV